MPHIDEYVLIRRRTIVEQPGEPARYIVTILASPGMGTFDVVGLLTVAAQQVTCDGYYVDEQGVMEGIDFCVEDDDAAEADADAEE